MCIEDKIMQLKLILAGRDQQLQFMRKWFSGERDDYTHAVTLTYPFDVKNKDEAEVYVGRFSKRINKMSNRRAIKDTEKLKIVALYHGLHSKEHIHAHCAIRSPIKFNFEVFDKLIKKAWKGAVMNNEAVCHIEEYRDDGWIGYSERQLSFYKESGISQYCNF